MSAALLFTGCIDEIAFCQYEDTKLNALNRRCVVETDATHDTALRSHGKQPFHIIIRFQDGTERQELLEDVPWLKAPSVEDRFKQEAWAHYNSHTVDEITRTYWELVSKGKKCAKQFELLAVPQKLSVIH